MSILASLMRNRRWLRHRRCRKREMFLSVRSEEHTSELQSQSNLVCRLLLEKKKKISDHDPLIINNHPWSNFTVPPTLSTQQSLAPSQRASLSFARHSRCIAYACYTYLLSE